jgi:hypothetical protein
LESCFRNTIENTIAWLPTLADSSPLYLSIDFALFFLDVGRNQLSTGNKVRHLSSVYRIFSAKKNEEKVCAPISFCLISPGTMPMVRREKYQAKRVCLSR